jgi:hypothetical protein
LAIGNLKDFGLTLSISRAIGRYDYAGTTTKVFYADATGQGSSGTPIFDANTGVLIAIEQMGLDGVWAGGAPITTVREAVRRNLAGLGLLPAQPKEPTR